jgi:hypothetical protein
MTGTIPTSPVPQASLPPPATPRLLDQLRLCAQQHR